MALWCHSILNPSMPRSTVGVVTVDHEPYLRKYLFLRKPESWREILATDHVLSLMVDQQIVHTVVSSQSTVVLAVDFNLVLQALSTRYLWKICKCSQEPLMPSKKEDVYVLYILSIALNYHHCRPFITIANLNTLLELQPAYLVLILSERADLVFSVSSLLRSENYFISKTIILV